MRKLWPGLNFVTKILRSSLRTKTHEKTHRIYEGKYQLIIENAREIHSEHEKIRNAQNARCGSLMDERAHGEQKGTSWESGRESLGERARNGWMNADGNAWETYRTTQPGNRRENLERTHGTRHEKMCEGWHSR